MKTLVAASLSLSLVAVLPTSAAVFTDTFDSGVNGSRWEVMPGSTNYQTLVGDNAHVYGSGGGSAKQVNADPWVYYSRTTSTAFTPINLTTGQKAVLSVQVWDDNVQSGAQTAAAVMLAASGGSDFYQLQVNSTKSWTNFSWRTLVDGTFASSIPRSQGWHEFRIEVSPYTGNAGDVQLYVDNTLAANGKRNAERPIDQIRLGISIKTPGSPFWYDNVNLNVVPEPATLGLLGLGVLMIRRRRA